MKLQQFMRLTFPNGEIALIQIFNRIDLNNCLKSN
jgi:hypothetical protein